MGERNMLSFDYLIVGAGFFGSVFAHKAKKKGKKCLVIDKRSHIGGNSYTQKMAGIQVHKYGAHIFHTNNKEVWDYVNSLAPFNRFTNSPIANYKGKLYNLPFNMNTFYQLWGVKTPEEAKARIGYRECDAKNLEQHAISLAGKDIYQKLIKGYTEKQWGKACKNLPASIIKRVPLRFTFNNDYFGELYQGIPIGGYTQIFEKLLSGIEIKLKTDYLKEREYFNSIAKKIIYTGAIDEFFEYKFGNLEYRSLRFETEKLNIENFQGNAVVNYTDRETPYTRIIEHKHFDWVNVPKTIITREYPADWQRGKEAYYPINNEKNTELLKKYQALAKSNQNVIFCGRLGEYKYYDMDDTIELALKLSEVEHGV
ncbi:MAG: UDP-galactopyranose mutase [Fibromonadales bacterium]|nr:UDP-galactopyranose mutase [Fibromonadales bacterium]